MSTKIDRKIVKYRVQKPDEKPAAEKTLVAVASGGSGEDETGTP